MPHRWTHPKPLSRGGPAGEIVAEGETFEATDAELAAFPDRIVDVSDDSEASDDGEKCGAPLTSGGTCDRPATSCPYHSDDTASET
jgi:hypothetical protein